MERILKSVVIATPPEMVFGYLTEPANLLEVWPSMVEVTNAKVTAEGAHDFDWVYKMAGVKFHGHAATVEVIPNRLRVIRNESGIPSTFRWTYEPIEGGTRLALDVAYELPLLARLAKPFLRSLNEREAETLLANIKARLETRAAKPEPRVTDTEPVAPAPTL